jgi:hypothetical protein
MLRPAKQTKLRTKKNTDDKAEPILNVTGLAAPMWLGRKLIETSEAEMNTTHSGGTNTGTVTGTGTGTYATSGNK